jgi:O-antigen/teichoic acid export membrane protein
MAFLKNVSINAFYKGGYLLLQFLFTVLISKLTGPEGLGIFTLVLVNATVFNVFTSLGLSSGIVYQAANNEVSTNTLLKTAWFSSGLQFICIVIVEGLFYSLFATFIIWSNHSIWYGIMGTLLFFTISITEKYFAIYNGYEQLKTYNLILTAINIVIVAICGCCFLRNYSITIDQILFLFIALNVFQVILLHSCLKQRHLEMTSSSNIWKRELFQYSMIAFFSNCLYFVALRIDYWMITVFSNKTQLGFYALSVRLAQLLWIFPTLLASLLLPQVRKSTFQNQQLERLIRLVFTGNLLLAGFMGVIGYLLIPYFFGESFSESIIPFCLLLPGIVFLSLQILLSAYFSGKGLIKTNLITSTFLLILITVLDLLLIPTLGIIGASMASSLAYVISGLFAFYLYCIIERYPFYNVLIQKGDWYWMKELIIGKFKKLYVN